MQQAEDLYGPFEGHWRGYHPAGGAPPLADNPTGQAEKAALKAGKKLHLSWRPYEDPDNGRSWARTVSGDMLRQTMGRLQDYCGEGCPEVWLSVVHEPELDWRDHCPTVNPCPGWTYADFKNMWGKVVQAREDAGAGKVKLAWVVQGNPDRQKHYYSLWPGNDKVDIVGQDPYIDRGDKAEDLPKRMIERTKWFRDESAKHNGRYDYASKPHIFAEYGCDLGGDEEDRGTAEHRGRCIDEVREALPGIAGIPGIQVVEMDFFDAGSGWIEDADGSPDHEAYKRLKAATER
ncbi:hypothetical protein OHA71_48035 [Streptomyces sp. NBC_00444]|uniref:hypothetical protein n=1 Tax=Streptomyces sp. NBC_00444 TaxID=2975744 RepID=UPI002E1E89BC